MSERRDFQNPAVPPDAGNLAPTEKKTVLALFPENQGDADFSLFAMSNSDPYHSSTSPCSLPETYFGDVEFHLRNSHVFALDEESDTSSGFKPPTLSAYKQSLKPLHRGTPGRATGRVQATLHTALNEYFTRVGWAQSVRPGCPGTSFKNVSGAGQSFSEAA